MLLNTRYSWGLGVCLGLFVLYVSRVICIPFALGFFLAYILNYPLKCLMTLGIKRLYASVLLTLILYFGILFFVLNIIPFVKGRLLLLINNIPNDLQPILSDVLLLENEKYLNIFKMVVNEVIKTGINSLGSIIAYISNIFFSFIYMIITLIITFFFLKDWEKIIAKALSWIPQEHLNYVLSFCTEIHNQLYQYFYCQIIVCFIMTVFYILCFLLIQVSNPILVSIFMGFSLFIPYIGFLIGISFALLNVLIPLQPVSLLISVLIVCCIGLGLENFIVSPRIVAYKLKIHPMIVFLVFLFLNSFFGSWGIVFSMPIMVIANVCYSRIITYYYKRIQEF